MNENIVEKIDEKNKYKLYINELYNEIVEIVEFIENVDPENFQEYFKTFNKSNSFIINKYSKNYVVDLIKENYDVDIELKHKHYNINNKDNYTTEIIIVDPIFQIIPIDKYKFKKIIHDIIRNNELFIFYNIHDEINKSIDYIYYLNDENYINHYSIENKINSYDLLKLFDEIVDDVVEYNENNNEKIDVDELIELFKLIIEKLNELNDLNEIYHYFNSNRKFKINLNSSLKYLCYNNKFDINYNDEIIYDILYNDLYELFVDPEIFYYMNFKFEIDYNINDNLFYEFLYMNNLIDDENFNFNYVVDDENYYIEISIDDIIELNENIDNIKDLLFDPFKIDEIFENYNNNYDDDEFIYLIFENEYYYLYNDELFENKYYYELNDMKFYSIDELKKYVLNYLSTLNLNCCFKFDDELFI